MRMGKSDMMADRDSTINDLNIAKLILCNPQMLTSEMCIRIGQAITNAIALLKAQEPITGETSDGYHTFNELYHHRAVLFSVIVANYPDRAWKSKKHHDGTMYNGMFIVGIDTPDGQATYHYDIDPYWDMFKCRVLDSAPEWDGHTPAQAIERIGKLKVHEPRILTLEEVRNLRSLYDGAVWLEALSGLFPALPEFCTSDITFFTAIPLNNYHGHFDNNYYGKTWRCWTSRPTDEQRRMAKWNDTSKTD